METITKEKIAEILRSKLGFSAIICEEIVNQIFNNIQTIVNVNQKLSIKNFGTFCVKDKKPRIGMNFHTKEQIIIKSRKVMRFIPAKKLKNLINNK